jgi:hypothetical protein
MKKGQVRKTEIHRRRKRREKLRKLRSRYSLAKTNQEKEKILEKVKRIAPWLSEEEFLEPLKNKKAQD